MKFKRIISMVLSTVITVTSTAVFTRAPIIQNSIAVAAENNTTYSSWQEGYHEEIINLITEDDFVSQDKDGSLYEYGIKDINADGIPELMIKSSSAVMPSFLYTFYDNKVIRLMGLAKGGSVTYCEEDNICSGGGGSAGYYYDYTFTIQNGEIKKIDEVYWDGLNKYTLNEKEITKEEFQKWIDSGRSKTWSGFETKKISNFICKEEEIYYTDFFDYYEAYYVDRNSTATELTIKNTINGLPVTQIGNGFLNGNNLKILNIPESIQSVYYMSLLLGDSLEAINIDPANHSFTSKDGVMYNKAMTKIIKFPANKDINGYSFPDSVNEIAPLSFAMCSELKRITIPEKICIIDEAAFSNCPNLSSITILNPSCEIYDYWDDKTGVTICNSFDQTKQKYSYLGVICGYDGSTAQAYAENFDCTFISLGADPKSTTTTTKPTTTTTKKTTTTTKPTTTTTKKTTTTTKKTTTTTTTTTQPISIGKTEITIKNGEQYVIPANRNDLTYKSNNNDIAIVSSKGIITAVGTGNAVISVIDSEWNVVQINVTVTTSAKQGLPGDSNMDNQVDLSDVVLIMQSLANPNKYGLSGSDKSHLTEQGAANADVEGGNGITANDALTIQQYLLKIISKLPV